MKEKIIEGMFLLVVIGLFWVVITIALNIGVDQQVCNNASYQTFMQLHCQDISRRFNGN